VPAQPLLALRQQHRVLGVDVLQEALRVVEREGLERRPRLLVLVPGEGLHLAEEPRHALVVAPQRGDRAAVARQLPPRPPPGEGAQLVEELHRAPEGAGVARA
jgi:hypothetical protein